MSAILIRSATLADAPALLRLAALDSAPALAEPALVAEVDGKVAAAVGVDGGAIADPFRRSAGLVAHLRLALAESDRALPQTPVGSVSARLSPAAC